MENGGVTAINVFELFKKTALIDVDKNCADSNDYDEWERHIFCNSSLLGQSSAVGLQNQNFHQIMWSLFCDWVEIRHQKRLNFMKKTSSLSFDNSL